MKRANVFVIRDRNILRELADKSVLESWNEVNYEKRQYISIIKRFSRYPKHPYNKYVYLNGSATA